MRAALLASENGFCKESRPDSTRLSESVQDVTSRGCEVDAPQPREPSPRADSGLDTIVHLFLRDNRVVPPRKTAVDLMGSGTAVADMHGQQLVDAQELFGQLQLSLSAIKGLILFSFRYIISVINKYTPGPAILSCPYYLDSSYVQYLACWENGDLVPEHCTFDPNMLKLPKGNKLVITLEKVRLLDPKKYCNS